MCVGGEQGGMRLAQNRESEPKQKMWAWGTAGGRGGRLVTNKGIGQINKYNKENGSQVSYCQRRVIQIWKDKKIETLVLDRN